MFWSPTNYNSEHLAPDMKKPSRNCSGTGGEFTPGRFRFNSMNVPDQPLYNLRMSPINPCATSDYDPEQPVEQLLLQ
jgi:hypothetical protein